MWARQGQALREEQVPGIAHLVALVRRYLPYGEVLELLGERVASAADLASVVTYRAAPPSRPSPSWSVTASARPSWPPS
ncbi:hypothetical protein ACFQ08_44670, partial [Streptosporangium algeriense]